jgi:hypothetical protein
MSHKGRTSILLWGGRLTPGRPINTSALKYPGKFSKDTGRYNCYPPWMGLVLIQMYTRPIQKGIILLSISPLMYFVYSLRQQTSPGLPGVSLPPHLPMTENNLITIILKTLFMPLPIL